MSEHERILIVDPAHGFGDVLRGFAAHEALELVHCAEATADEVSRVKPTLILLDSADPAVNAFEACRRIKQNRGNPGARVIVLGHSDQRRKALEAGADEFLVRPVAQDQLTTRIHAHLQYRHTLSLLQQRVGVPRPHAELFGESSRASGGRPEGDRATMICLLQMLESSFQPLAEHLNGVRDYALLLAEALGSRDPYRDQIPVQFLEDLHRAAPLHDVGKAAIPDAILNKPGPLTPEEFGIVKQHVIFGGDALQQAARLCGADHSFLLMAADIARYHHERFDGTGYCCGMHGEQIPLPARLVALADVFDALTSSRAYKPAYEPERAKQMIEEAAGSHFDPVVVQAFVDRFDDFRAQATAESFP